MQGSETALIRFMGEKNEYNKSSEQNRDKQYVCK